TRQTIDTISATSRPGRRAADPAASPSASDCKRKGAAFADRALGQLLSSHGGGDTVSGICRLARGVVYVLVVTAAQLRIEYHPLATAAAPRRTTSSSSLTSPPAGWCTSPREAVAHFPGRVLSTISRKSGTTS